MKMAQWRSIRVRKGFVAPPKEPSSVKTQPEKPQPQGKTMFSGKDLKRKFKTKHMARHEQLRLEKLRKGNSRLRQIYLQDLRFHRYRPLTIKMYLDFLLKFFAIVWKRPEQITDEDLRNFFRYIEEELRWSNSYLMGVFSAIKFFFDYTCPRKFKTLELYRQPHPKTFPEVLSHEEVRRILSFATDVRYHAYLVLVYSCGLRAREGMRIKFSDIDDNQGLLRITDGKGGKNRMVPIPQNTLRILREMWLTHKHPRLLFPGYIRYNCGTKTRTGITDKPVSYQAFINYFQEMAALAGITKKIGLHTLRHSYATHLLEEGIPSKVVQEYLGHESMATTAIYLHLTKKMKREGATSLEKLMGDL